MEEIKNTQFETKTDKEAVSFLESTKAASITFRSVSSLNKWLTQ